jgi:5-formyltetrahydrofolate cyclo-ligase
LSSTSPSTTCGRHWAPAEGAEGSALSSGESVREAKAAVRDRVWAELERRGAARFPGAKGRIPNFVGAEAAADKLASTEEWKAAKVVKANPDSPQLPVRARALEEGKLLYMAVPRLAKPEPFLELDPARLEVAPRRAVSIKGADRHGKPIKIEEMKSIDMVVCGTVAINHKGVRIGKGGGYSDLEFALLTEMGLVTTDTTLATTVHQIQVLNEELAETDHDFRVQRIITPDEVRRCGQYAKRPSGILWDELDDDRISSIPVLAHLARFRKG